MEYVKLSLQEYDRLKDIDRALKNNYSFVVRHGVSTFYTNQEMEKSLIDSLRSSDKIIDRLEKKIIELTEAKPRKWWQKSY